MQLPFPVTLGSWSNRYRSVCWLLQPRFVCCLSHRETSRRQDRARSASLSNPLEARRLESPSRPGDRTVALPPIPRRRRHRRGRSGRCTRAVTGSPCGPRRRSRPSSRSSSPSRRARPPSMRPRFAAAPRISQSQAGAGTRGCAATLRSVSCSLGAVKVSCLDLDEVCQWV